jgi:Ca2+-binding RTX toxin-like protein
MRRDSDHGVLPRRARRLALARAGMRIVGDCTTHEQLIAIAASTRKVRVLVVGGNRWKAEVRAAPRRRRRVAAGRRRPRIPCRGRGGARPRARQKSPTRLMNSPFNGGGSMWSYRQRRLGVLTAIVCSGLAATALVASAAETNRSGFPGRNGRIVFNDQSGSLVLANPDGTGLVRLANTGTADQYIGASFSPDGRRIAYSKVGNDPDIFTIRPDGSDQREVTFSRGWDIDPTWSGDGSQIAFETNRNGNWDIFAVNANGSAPVQLTSSQLDDQDPAWSTSGKITYTVESANHSKRDLWVMNADGSSKQQLTNAPNFSENPNWSPDGKWIVFESDRAEKGNLDIYKMHADGTGLTELTNSPALDALAAFSPDGKQIVFVSDRAAKDSRKLFVMTASGGAQTRLIQGSGFSYQMVPDWQPISAKDPCTIRGTIGSDHLAGTPHADVICGLGGNDLISGLGGNDRLDGGAGNDQLNGGPGSDILLGGAGNDWINAKDGHADRVNGGPGADRAIVDPKLDSVTAVEKVNKK